MLCEYLRGLNDDFDSFDIERNIARWKISVAKKKPMQIDGFNCGLFVCMYARSVIQQKWLDFEGEADTLRKLRKLMLHELINEKLIDL